MAPYRAIQLPENIRDGIYMAVLRNDQEIIVQERVIVAR